MKLHALWNNWIGRLAIGGVCALLVACGGGGDATTVTPPAVTPPAVTPPVVTPPAVTPPSATPVATLRGSVSDAASGAGIAGVQVSAGGQTTLTAASGAFTLPVGTGTQVVSFNKAGYAEQTKVNSDLNNAGDSSFVNATMLAFAQSTPLTGTAAQTVTVAGSTAAVALPADGLRRADGSAAQGVVTVNLTPINPAANVNTMPGSLVTVVGGATTPIESFGALNVTIADASGAPLNLRSGQSATIRIPATTRGAALPATIPLFHFNTATGQWVQEGTATLVGSGATAYYQGTVTHFSTWNADRVSETVFINSCVVNASGTAVVGARISSEGVDYVGNSSATSDAAGKFRIAVKASSRAALTASSNGLVGTSVAINSSTVDQTVTACLTLTQAAVTIKLSWGAQPSDLDSHIWVPNATGTAQEVYYSNRGSLGGSPYVNLDVDDVSSFGPEYITIGRVAKNSTYRYWVRNYSTSSNPGVTASPARVELNIRGALTVFTPPAGETTSTYDWYAFDLVTDATCNIAVTPVNTWSRPTAPTYAGAPVYCN
jgi:Carboxypeptidase regulatory-like domain